MARVGDARLQHAVVRQQQQSLAVGIEPSGRIDVRDLDEVGKRGFAWLRAEFAHHAERLVECDQHSSTEKAFDQIRRHLGARHRRRGATAGMSGLPWLEPLAHVGIEADAMHVVIERLAPAAADSRDPCRGVVKSVVVRKVMFGGGNLVPYRRGSGRWANTPWPRSDARSWMQPAASWHAQRVDGVLFGLRRKCTSIHHDAGIGESAGDARLLDSDALLHDSNNRSGADPLHTRPMASCGITRVKVSRRMFFR